MTLAMKMVLIFYNEAVDEEVNEALVEAGIESFTKWKGVSGKGKRGGTRLATHIWPGANNALAIVATEDRCRLLLDKIRQLRKTETGKAGLKAFMLPVEDLTE
ncbi:MAG: hypothetical protein N2246_05180 [Candidatus Sumerlaeia bacterium]|nr:hypothetical protein [Candidatus Sumerlaeia bacterium]